MGNWGFADSNGDEITRGWQGENDDARAYAQRLADQRGESISFWAEGSSEDDEPETVDPE